MVKKIITIICIFMLVFVLNISAFAAEELRIEQFASKMPEVDVYFYSEQKPEASDVKLSVGQREITASEILTQSESNVIHHYFLVDTSTSTTSAQIEAVKQSINDFASNKNPNDTVTLITFGVEVNALLERETNSETIIETASTMQANEAGTLFFDAIAMVSNLAKSEDIATQRKLLYVFSDSVDYNLGGYTDTETLDLLLEANLPLYAFGFDNGTKENLDNFGALARMSGGAINIVNAQNLQEQFAQNTNYVNSDVYIAKFDTGSNILPDSSTEITLNVMGEVKNFTPTFNYFVPDNTEPQIISAVQKSENTLEIIFSEPLSGANLRENYIILTEDGTPVGIESAAYEDAKMTVLLTLNVPKSGTLSIKCENITDLSRENNKVSNTVNADFEISEAAQNQAAQGQTEQSTAPIGAYIFLVAIIITIAVVIIIVASKKKNIAPQQVTNDAITMPLNNPQIVNSGETGKAHFVHNSNKNIILEVVNTSGAGKRVTLPIAKTMFVGRSDICDVVFDDIKMSRQHFVIEENNGAYTITNLSNGGTLLNGVPINSARQLNHGDRIQAGNHTIVFIIPR